jgi:hypothetical protein
MVSTEINKNTMTQSNKIKLLMELSNTLARTKKYVIFVAGPIAAENRKAIEAKLSGDGWHVLSVAAFMQCIDKENEMRVVMTLIAMADSIYMPVEWDECEISHRQWCYAVKAGLNVVYE